MKLLRVISRDGMHLYGAMIRKQAEIRRNGRGTFLRARARKHNAARWTHVRYKGSINFKPGTSEAVEVVIQSPERGDEARLLSSFLVGSTGISASNYRLSRSSTGRPLPPAVIGGEKVELRGSSWSWTHQLGRVPVPIGN